MAAKVATLSPVQVALQLGRGINQAILTPENVILAAADDHRVYALVQKPESGRFERSSELQVGYKAKTLAYDPRRRHVYVGCFLGHVYQLSLSSAFRLSLVRELFWHTREVSHIIYVPGYDVLMSSGFDGRLCVYNCASGQLVRHSLCPAPVRFLRYDDIGGKLYAGTHEGNGISVFSLEEPQESARYPPALAFRLGAPARGPKKAAPGELCHSTPVRWIDLDPRSRYVFSCDHAGQVLVFFAGAPGEERESPALGVLRPAEPQKLRCVSWDPRARLVYSCGRDRAVSVWDAIKGSCIGSRELHEDEVMGLLLLPANLPLPRPTGWAAASLPPQGGQLLLTWGRDGKLALWSCRVDLRG